MLLYVQIFSCGVFEPVFSLIELLLSASELGSVSRPISSGRSLARAPQVGGRAVRPGAVGVRRSVRLRGRVGHCCHIDVGSAGGRGADAVLRYWGLVRHGRRSVICGASGIGCASVAFTDEDGLAIVWDGVRHCLGPFMERNIRWRTQGPVAASAVGQITRRCGRLVTLFRAEGLAGLPPSAMRVREPARPDRGLQGRGSWT